MCVLEEDSGPCQAYFNRWRFDESSGQCIEFVYGGCGGNNNRFASREECRRTCRSLLTDKKIGRFIYMFVLLTNLMGLIQETILFSFRFGEIQNVSLLQL